VFSSHNHGSPLIAVGLHLKIAVIYSYNGTVVGVVVISFIIQIIKESFNRVNKSNISTYQHPHMFDSSTSPVLMTATTNTGTDITTG